jgi:hypothetical protein
MMAADSLHVAVLSSCHRACRSAAAAVSSRVQCGCIRTALRAAFGAAVQRAGVLPRTRPACGHRRVRRRAGCSAAAPPGRRRPERQRGQRRKARQRTRHLAASKASLHMGWRGTERLRRRAALARGRANAGMSACFARRTRQSLQERSHDRPPRRRFPRAPQRPEEPGQGPGPELRFQGAQAGRQGQQRQVGGAPSWGGRHRPAARLAPGRGTRRRASPGRS